MHMSDLLRHNEKLRSNAVAITFGGNAFTYAELGERARRAASALAANGIKRGDRVALLAQNCNQYVELYFAAAELGSVTTPLNYRLATSELEYIIADSEAVALVVEDRFVPNVEPILERFPRVRIRVCIGERRPGFVDYEEWIAGATRVPAAAEISENDLIWQMYTSGTTGRPKGAMITHRNLCTNVAQVCMGFGEMTDKARTLIVAPLYHAAAVIVSMVTIAQGGCLVIQREFILTEVVKAFDEEGVTHALLVPAMILFLLSMPGVEKVNFGSLGYVMYGASAIPLEVLKKAMATFRCKFFQGFGQTESVAVLTQLSADDHERAATSDDPNVQRLLSSCGREMYGTDVRIVGEDDRELPRGEVGEIEEVLFQHPAVADAAVIGVPSEKWGEEPKAFVVLKPGVTANEADLVAFSESKLAGYKRPRSVDFVSSLPKNPSGRC